MVDKARDEVYVAQRELEKLQELIRTKDAELDNWYVVLFYML